MPTTNSAQQSQSQSPGQQPGTGSKNQGNKTMLYIGIAAIVIIVILVAAVLLAGSSPNSLTGQPTIGSNAGTPVYVSQAEMQRLIGSNVSQYYATDLFNMSSPLNITDIEYFSGFAAGNVTEGWASAAFGSNATTNDSVEFFIMQSNNASALAGSLATALSQSFYPAPSMVNGTASGLSYTYEEYDNSTGNFQTVTGWKDNHVVMVLVSSNSPYSINQTALIGAAANYTP